MQACVLRALETLTVACNQSQIRETKQWTQLMTCALDTHVSTTGGAKVLDGICAALKLDEKRMTPSRAVLHDFGNISSSTTW